jgi:arabinogalactan oligomer/maltooligosaccharide transport system permease protein
MTIDKVAGAEGATLPRPRGDAWRPETPSTHRGNFVIGLVVKIFALGIVGALAIAAAGPLIAAQEWMWLSLLVATTGLIFYVYLSPRRIALKYFVPGLLLLVAFQLVPVVYTASMAFTNFGDGHRGSKQEAIEQIQSSSVRRVPGSVEYGLSVATREDDADGELVFLLLDPEGQGLIGDAEGLRPLAPGSFTASGTRITAADGYRLLSLSEASLRSQDITALVVPTEAGAVRANGITRAFEGRAVNAYDAECDCIVNVDTGETWTADNQNGKFVNAAGERLPQGWKVNIGLRNFAVALTDPRISTHFLGTLLWNIAFAALSVFVTFVLGTACALALHSDRIRGLRIYRILLVLPYAMPSFAMLLVWSDMFNRDFGLVNKLLGLDVDWFGGAWSARLAVIIIQLWLGYPYMFLVATGALQAMPRELAEAAAIDGASPWARLRQVTLPLLLVALSPLLISSFAYNFNNFNAIRLTTDGGPFPPTDSTAGATDLLITYTYRLAFGGSGAQAGLAAAISIYIFFIVAIFSLISFRRTIRHEEVFS